MEDSQKNEKKIKLFTYSSKNPENFGVLTKKNSKFYIYEKPKKFVGSEIVTGLYFLPNKAIDISRKIRSSKRGELEISDVLNKIMHSIEPKVYNLKRGITWMDLGNIDSLNQASEFIKLIQNISNTQIGCLEEISLKNNWIKRLSKQKMMEKYGDSPYFKYLKNLNFF